MNNIISNCILTCSFILSIFFALSSINVYCSNILYGDQVYYLALYFIRESIKCNIYNCRNLGFQSFMLLRINIHPKLIGFTISIDNYTLLLSNKNMLFKVQLYHISNVIYVHSEVLIFNEYLFISITNNDGLIFVKLKG